MLAIMVVFLPNYREKLYHCEYILIFEKLILCIQLTGLLTWAKLFIANTNNEVSAFPFFIDLTY